MKRAVVSIDFDFFVREELIWDWGHNETTLFLNDIWPVRYAQMDVASETDPRKHADFMPEDLIRKMADKGLIVGPLTKVATAESHKEILKFVDHLDGDCPDVFVNIDAHHDMYKDPPPVDCGNWQIVLLDRWLTTRHIHVFPRWIDVYKTKDPLLKIDQTSWAQFGLSRPVIVEGLFICRSGCWVPPHLDNLFNRMVRQFHKDLCIPARSVDKKVVRQIRKNIEEFRRRNAK